MTFNDDTYSSVAANNSHHITKQKLLKIREIYEFCKNAQQNLQVRHIVNAKFAQIVEEAEEQIKLFAEGKLNIDNDALDLMKEYIEEFGRNYYKHGGQMRYEYSPEATKAKIMLEQHRYQTTRRQGAVSAEMSETFNLDAMSRGTADEFVLPDNEIFESDTAETAAAPMSEEYSMNIRETKSGVKEVSDNTALRIQRETENPAETVSVPMAGETVAEQPVVDEAEKIALSNVDAEVARAALPAVFKRDSPYLLRVLCGVLRHDGGGVIGRTVVDEDDLKIFHGLRKDGVHTFAQVFFRVINGNDYTKLHLPPSCPPVRAPCGNI